MDISKGGRRYTGQRVRRPCNVPTNQRHGPGHGEVIDIRRCERIAGNPSCQSLLDPGSRGKCHEYATIEVSKRTHPRHPRCIYTKMRCNCARHENGGRVDIANSTVDCPFEENSFRKHTNHADEPNTTGHACTRRVYTREGCLSIFGNFLPSHSIAARCL